MDDTQQSTQPTMSSQQSNVMPSTMGDIAGMPGTSTMPGGMNDQSVPSGMTPPPAPAMPTAPVSEFIPAEPAVPAMPTASEPTVPVDSSFGTPIMPGGVQPVRDVAMTPPPAPAMPIPDPTAVPHESIHHAGNAEEYSYAEDILNEILDSLDRIEAKLEALEKKQG